MKDIDNPLRAGLRLQRTPPPCQIVIFGASGDLTKRKLVPALYSMAQQNLLPPGFSIVGVARSEMSDDGFRQAMREALSEFAEGGLGDVAVWENFAANLFFHRADPKSPASFEKMRDHLQHLDQQRRTPGNRLFYLSVPPSSYIEYIRALGAAGLADNDPGKNWVRIIVEKPFGRDLKSAQELDRELLKVFTEDEIYRIDHYLGKETVQNIMVLRFANGIFEPLWNQRYIDHVQITAAESIGVENRGSYYEQAGAFRDMIQNHMLQLLTLVAMEPPAVMEANAVRDEKLKVMQAIRPFGVEEVQNLAVRGQYGKGAVAGQDAKGYRQEEQVNSESSMETFAAIRFHVDNWRWADVPFYLRSGKRLPKRVTEIAIQYKKVPHLLFSDDSGGRMEPNSLIIRIQPDEGIALKFGAKLPGQSIRIRPVSMDFQYGTSFGKRSPEAYERLLLDSMIGDSTLFARGDMLEYGWKLSQPILDAWQEPATGFPNYEAGTWGPAAADELIERDGRRWRKP